MRKREAPNPTLNPLCSFSISNTSPSSAITTIGANQLVAGVLNSADLVSIDMSLAGGTGGVLDVYLQRKIDTDTWTDWVHFNQAASTGTYLIHLVVNGMGITATAAGGIPTMNLGTGTDASFGFSNLSAAAFVNTIPAGPVRMVFTAGAGTTAGAVNKCRFTCYNFNT